MNRSELLRLNDVKISLIVKLEQSGSKRLKPNGKILFNPNGLPSKMIS